MMESVTGSPVADASSPGREHGSVELLGRDRELTGDDERDPAQPSGRRIGRSEWRRGVEVAAGVAAVTGHGAGEADAF